MSLMYESEESESDSVEIIDVEEDYLRIIEIERTLNPKIDPSHLENQWNPEIRWPELPSPVTENIYSYLNRTDQCQMSLVCTRWSKEYSSPSIWKTIKFCLPTGNQQADICPEVKVARKYGHMFRNVEIICKKVRYSFVDTVFRQLKLFLTALTHHSQLLSVKFRNIGRLFHRLGNNAYAELVRTIVLFLECQKYLRTVHFQDSQFSYEEAAEVLTAITTNCATITELVLLGFTDPENTARNETIANSLSRMWLERLTNLSSLEIEYSEIFENFLLPNSNIERDLKNTKCRALSRISLHCDGSRRAFLKGVTSKVWRRLKQICSHLVVDLYFIPGQSHLQDIKFYLVRDMPLRRLDYRSDRLRASSNMGLDVLFNHLHHIGCNLYLEDIYLIWMRRIPDISVLNPFLQSCPLLKYLQLFVRNPLNRVESLLQSWLVARPKSLEQVVISISNVRNREEQLNLNTLSDEYVPVLQAIGLNLYLIQEPGRF